MNILYRAGSKQNMHLIKTLVRNPGVFSDEMSSTLVKSPWFFKMAEIQGELKAQWARRHHVG